MTGPPPPTLAIFDLCDTLVAENTTLGYLDLLGRDHPRIARSVRRWTSKSHPVFYLGALVHRCGFDIARASMVRQLRGLDRQSLSDAADVYARDVLDRAGNAIVCARLSELCRASARVVIVSTSLDIVVEAVARALGVEGRGSRLGWNGDRCTGRIVEDITGRKDQVAREIAPKGWSRFIAFSDNALDLPLLELADEGVLVVPSGRRASYRSAGVDDVLFL